MDAAFWTQRWAEGRIGFHQAETNRHLIAHADHLGRGGTVLVPLCGKSRDMDFLATRFDRVVGVELVDLACVAFFAERDLEPTVEHTARGVRRTAGRCTLWTADFFALGPDDLGPIDAVFDRAAMIALPPDLRARYAAHLHDVLPAGARGLAVTLAYDQARVEGPPFSVPDAEVRAAYAAGFALERLAHEPATAMSPKFADVPVTSSVWSLVRR
ncbi:MAG: thiopurine S-methyltransferase [Myxococcales bacterium]|nr:thiopurine S-methyltransferase [Myxococcales bacterium]